MVYAPRMQTLVIVFRCDRGAYRYYDVSPEEWRLFKRSSSKGTYLNAVFKARHPRFESLRADGTILPGTLADKTVAPVDRPDENVWGFYETSF